MVILGKNYSLSIETPSNRATFPIDISLFCIDESVNLCKIYQIYANLCNSLFSRLKLGTRGTENVKDLF